MHHQFKELADIDITEEPMEVGPTTHYVMGGVRVDAESQMSTVPGLFAAGECASGLHGANRLGGNSLSDLLVFGRRAGEHAAVFASEHGAGAIDAQQVEAEAARLLEPFRREGGDGGNPHQIQHELQSIMQDRAGIIREAGRLEEALDAVGSLRRRAEDVPVAGNREYNPGWHTWIDLHNLLTVSEAVIRAAYARTESRGAHTRDDHPEKDPAWGDTNLAVRRGPDGEMTLERRTIPEMPDELKRIIEEQG